MQGVHSLVCDELQVMFRKMFNHRMKMQIFSATRDKRLYFAKAVWVTMQCHMVVDKFLSLGIKETGGFGEGDCCGAHSKSESCDKAIITGRLDKITQDIKSLKTKCGVNSQR
eukprot:scaffold118730_cov48-Cyclotella_meneghiniana.AAC.2